MGIADSRTHEVGQKQPNQLGLYDMSGNVWEWCKGLVCMRIIKEPQRITIMKVTESYRVVRGGSWNDSQSLRSLIATTSARTSVLKT